MNQNWLEHQVMPDEEERRAQGRYWLRLAAVSMIAAAVLYAAGLVVDVFLPRKAHAEEAVPTMSVTDGAGNIVRLTLDPCEGAPAWMKLRKAEMRYQDVDYVACWREVGGAVLVFDSNEDLTPIPAAAFKKDEPI